MINTYRCGTYEAFVSAEHVTVLRYKVKWCAWESATYSSIAVNWKHLTEESVGGEMIVPVHSVYSHFVCSYMWCWSNLMDTRGCLLKIIIMIDNSSVWYIWIFSSIKQICF